MNKKSERKNIQVTTTKKEASSKECGAASLLDDGGDGGWREGVMVVDGFTIKQKQIAQQSDSSIKIDNDREGREQRAT